MISTRCPACTRPEARACNAVPPEIPTTAACSNVQFAGLVDELVRTGRGALGERPTTHPEHLVAHGEPGDRRTDCDDRAGHIHAGNAVLRPAEPEPHEPHQIRLARQQIP